MPKAKAKAKATAKAKAKARAKPKATGTRHKAKVNRKMQMQSATGRCKSGPLRLSWLAREFFLDRQTAKGNTTSWD